MDKVICLCLERTRMTKVWIDDTFAGSFNSLNTPHIYDLTEFITKRQFRLTILVSNVDYPTKGGHLTSPDTQTNWNGIIGEIALHIYNPVHIKNIKTFPDIDTKSVLVTFDTVNRTGAEKLVHMAAKAYLTDINGDTGASAPGMPLSICFPPGENKAGISYSLGEDAALWSEYNPVTYRLELSINDSSEKSVTSFGLRKFSTTETSFLINGTPTFLRGKHDGLIFPMTGDENHNEEEQEYLIEEGFRMMEAFGNHASYCMMSLGNELWGSKERMAEIIRSYKKTDTRHLYTQGSNNFQHTPVLLPEDDFFVGVRFSKNRLIRGSYGMCDAPLGHIQWEEPSTMHNYDEEIYPSHTEDSGTDTAEEIEIQYGTGVKKVKAAKGEGVLLPHIPVISHEIGQFAVYPNFREIEKYTGVLKARNFEIFRERLEEKGMLAQADDFFYASGKLSVQCYKEELEAAARTRRLAGYQILDIQDFSGQGTALVGILDAFMDSKGHVSPEEWAGYCSDGILLAQFASYIHTNGETFPAAMAIRYYNPEKLVGRTLHWELHNTAKDTRNAGISGSPESAPAASGDIPIPDNASGLVSLGDAAITIPDGPDAAVYTLTLTVPGTPMKNSYELYSYPVTKSNLALDAVSNICQNGIHLFLTQDFEEAAALLQQGKRVLYLPNEVKESIEGFYCTDF